jgi:pentatricopeptide repeat protein
MQKVGVMPNDYAFTTMISAYGKAGNYSKAIELLDQMQATGVEPSVVTYNAVISACARAGDGQRALDWLEQMEAASIKPNATSYAQVMYKIHLSFVPVYSTFFISRKISWCLVWS